MGVVRRFVKYNSVEGSLNIKEGMTSQDDVGEYLMRIKLTNDMGLESTYSFLLKVVDPASLLPVLVEEESDSQETLNQEENGLVYVAPDEAEIPEPQLELLLNSGEATISFSRNLVPIKNLTELKNATVVLADYGVKPAIEIEVIPGNDTDGKSSLGFDYEITSFDEDGMTIQFNFTNATEVSMNFSPDSVKITFWAWNLFIDTDGTTFKPAQIRQRNLPPQIPLGHLSALRNMGAFY